jgi:hypothetical protein
MLQRGRSEVGVNDMTRLIVEFCDPFCKLHTIGDGGGQENVTDRVRKKDNGLLPHNTSIYDNACVSLSCVTAEGITKRTLVSHIMNLVKDNPSNLSHDFGTSVQHGSKNLQTLSTESVFCTTISSQIDLPRWS